MTMPPLSTPSFNSLYTEDAGTKYGALAGLMLGLLPRLLGLGKDKNTNSTAPTAVQPAATANPLQAYFPDVSPGELGDYAKANPAMMQQPQMQPSQTSAPGATAQQGGIEKLLASLTGNNGGGLGGLGGTGGLGSGMGSGGATSLPGGATGPNGQPFQPAMPQPVSYAGTGYQGGGAQALNNAAGLQNGPGGYPLGPAANNPFLAALLRQQQQQRPMS